MHKDFDHGDMVANILTYRRSATFEQEEAGAGWYEQARKIADVIADSTGIDAERIVFAIAALSPRNPWRWNVMDAYSFASAAAEGRAMPTATTFKRNQIAAWACVSAYSRDPWATAAPKVRAFVRCIMGDTEAVVVDTWAARIATGGQRDAVRNDAQYLAVAAAYRQAAMLVGESASTTQAITWVVAQTEGLASMRRGRHDLAFKSGTPEFLRIAMGA